MNQEDDSHVTSELRLRFEEAASRASERLFGIAFSWTHNVDLANDLVQEAFQRFISRMNAVNWSQDIKSFDAYLTTTAHHCWIDLLRKQAKERFESLDSDPAGKLHKEAYQALEASKAFTGLDPESLEDLQKAVPEQIIFRELDDDDRKILWLHRGEGLRPKEIARQRGEDADKLRYRLIKLETKVRYRAKQYLKASGKKSLF